MATCSQKVSFSRTFSLGLFVRSSSSTFHIANNVRSFTKTNCCHHHHSPMFESWTGCPSTYQCENNDFIIRDERIEKKMIILHLTKLHKKLHANICSRLPFFSVISYFWCICAFCIAFLYSFKDSMTMTTTTMKWWSEHTHTNFNQTTKKVEVVVENIYFFCTCWMILNNERTRTSTCWFGRSICCSGGFRFQCVAIVSVQINAIFIFLYVCVCVFI